jgi:hypothetical protein
MACAVCWLSLLSAVQAQKLNLVRTDTDARRSEFVTAGYLFGIDIAADSLSDCFRVLFELEYNNISSIQYSGYKPIFEGTDSRIIANPQVDSLSATGTIAVVALLSDAANIITYNNPNIIHFNFVVAQNAVHSTSTVFKIKNIQAYLRRSDGIDTVISIPSDTIIYTIHGYVSVWPGDADNNGNVDNQDFYRITQMLGQGSAIKGSKSFKREPASAIWKAQQSMAWDSVEAAYCDCDGNGDVTPDDMLIVFLNFNKTHVNSIAKGSTTTINMSSHFNIIDTPTYDFKIPIRIESDRVIKGAVGTLNINSLPNGCKITGVEAGEYFSNGNVISFYYINDNDGTCYIATGCDEAPETCIGSGIIAYLLIDSRDNSTTGNIVLNSINGIDENGFVFPLEQTTEVFEENSDNQNGRTVEYTGKEIKIVCNDFISSPVKISVFNVTGTGVFSETIENLSKGNELFIATDNLPSGMYFLVFSDTKSIDTYPVCVCK